MRLAALLLSLLLAACSDSKPAPTKPTGAPCPDLSGGGPDTRTDEQRRECCGSGR